MQTRINDQIRISPIRAVDSDGTQLGIISTDDAIAKAVAAGMDLVEVAPNERPPVCRIMDFGKFKYDKKKRLAQSSHVTKTKEIRLRPKTGQHDIDFKINHAREFLEHKDKVTVSVIFRACEALSMLHTYSALKIHYQSPTSRTIKDDDDDDDDDDDE